MKSFFRRRKTPDDFEAWQKENPDKKYHQYYVEKVVRRLEAGRPHATLGGNLRHDETFASAGLEEFSLLRQMGLKPEHVCVDFGCGSLRIGQHLIDYLAPGHYWGLDVTPIFYQQGAELIGQALLDEKKPQLREINAETLGETCSAAPDFVLAAGVLHHVPPAEFDEFVDNVMSITCPNTRTFIEFKASDEPKQYGVSSWSYPESMLNEAVERRGGQVKLHPIGSKFREKLGDEMRLSWMEVTRRSDTR